jgi:hypothetical protein
MSIGLDAMPPTGTSVMQLKAAIEAKLIGASLDANSTAWANAINTAFP